MSEEPQVSGDEVQEAAVPPETVEETQTSEQDRQVPLSALESERAKRQDLEEKYRMMTEHNALLQARQTVPTPPTKDEWDGMDDSDVMTVGEFKKLSNKLASQFQMNLAEVKMTQKHPDYQEVITKYLPEVLKENPHLRTSLEKSQDYELAYHLAKSSPNYSIQNKKAKRNADAERIVRNTQAAGSLSSMGASTPVMQAKGYKSMTDDEFRRLTEMNRG